MKAQKNFGHYDYSTKAKLEHKRTLQVVDALRARGIPASVASVNSGKQDKVVKAAVSLIKNVFNETDREKRKVMWIEFKVFIKKYKLTLDMTNLMNMRRIWKRIQAKKAA